MRRIELGTNIIPDPQRSAMAQQKDLRNHLIWYKEGIISLRLNPYNELSEDAIRSKIGTLTARISVTIDQINRVPLLKKEYSLHIPLDAESARRKDLFQHRRALRAGIKRAGEQGKYRDEEEFEVRLEELQREIDLSFPTEINV